MADQDHGVQIQPLPGGEAAPADATRLAGSAFFTRMAAEQTRIAGAAYQSRVLGAGQPPTVPEPAPAAEPDRYRIGDSIAKRYEVLAVHHGSLGVVYGCFDRQEELPRALKTLQPRFAAQPGMMRLFEQEAALWVRLEKHPFIVRAYLVDRLEDQPYVITEYIRGGQGMGGDLRGWLGHRRLTLPVAVEMALQIAQGMQHAVRRVPGLVHRDLKPANILVDDQGRAMVTDFGLVYAAETDAGTPAYMAPEQWLKRGLDARTDLYAFGCILYEMLTAHRLFPAVTAEDWQTAHLVREPVAPTRLNPALPDELDGLLLRCLAKQPEGRPGGWDEVVEILAEIFHRLTGQAAVRDFSAYQLGTNELIAASYSLIQLERSAEALAACNRAIAIDEKCEVAWTNRIAALKNLKRYDAALASYDRWLSINGRSLRAWYGKGACLFQLERYKDALDHYNLALSLYPDEAGLWTEKGITLCEMRLHKDASPCYLRAVELVGYSERLRELAQDFQLAGVSVPKLQIRGDSGDLATWLKQADLLKHQRDSKGALACYDQALAIAPDCIFAWLEKVDILSYYNRIEEALTCSEEAVTLAPEYAVPWYVKAGVLSNLGRNEEALACIEKVISIAPDHAVPWQDKGSLLRCFGRNNEALACYERALDIAQIARIDLGSWYENRFLKRLYGLDEMTLAFYKLVLDDVPIGDLWYSKGSVLEVLERKDEALACYDQAQESYYQYFDLLNSNLWEAKRKLLALLKGPEAVQASYDEELAGYDLILATTDSKIRLFPARQRKIDLLKKLGRHDDLERFFARSNTLGQRQKAVADEGGVEAVRALDAVLTHHPDDRQTLLDKAAALGDLGRWDEALDCLDQALVMNRADGATWRAKAEALLQFCCQGRSEVSSYDVVKCFLASSELCRESALACYQQAVALIPADLRLRETLISVLKAIGRKEDVLNVLDQALAIFPDDYEACRGKAYLLMALGREHDALLCFDRLVAINKDRSWKHKLMALLHFGHFSDALEFANHVGANALRDKCDILKAFGLNEEALACILEIKINWYFHLEEKCDLLRRLQRYDEALSCSDAFRTRQPQDAGAYFSLRGDIFRDLGQHEDAVAAYDQAGDDSRAWIGKGDIFMARKQYEVALACYDSSKSSDAFRGSTAALRSLGRHEEALARYERDLVPSDWMRRCDEDAWRGMATVLQELGRHDEADACLKRVQAIARERTAILRDFYPHRADTGGKFKATGIKSSQPAQTADGAVSPPALIIVPAGRGRSAQRTDDRADRAVAGFMIKTSPPIQPIGEMRKVAIRYPGTAPLPTSSQPRPRFGLIRRFLALLTRRN